MSANLVGLMLCVAGLVVVAVFGPAIDAWLRRRAREASARRTLAREMRDVADANDHPLTPVP